MIHDEFLLHRHPANPILTPKDFPGADGVRNCGQTMLGEETILLVSIDHRSNMYRGQWGRTSHVARSKDGIHFTIDPEPFLQRPPACMEPYHALDMHPIDSRITKIGDTYYVVHPGGYDWGTSVMLGKTKDFRRHEFIDVIALPDNRVPCLFPEQIGGLYVRIDRPYKPGASPENGNLWISYSPDLIYWGHHRPVIKYGFAHWNTSKVGPTPPVETDAGWLTILHGVTHSCAGARYYLGAILLDLENPTKVLGWTNSYILAPLELYEQNGRVQNIVFACGAIPDYAKDELRVYYGGADTCIGLATGKISELVDACLRKL
jgi:predicted GH43/DUF377 family glycosyl hydrolase